jgi:uncharacterized protein
VPVDPLRFRAGVYFDGAAAWAEHDWIDSEITSDPHGCGSSRRSPDARRRKSIRLPQNGTSTLSPPSAISNMGVYAEVVAGGEIAAHDPLLSGRDASAVQT